MKHHPTPPLLSAALVVATSAACGSSERPPAHTPETTVSRSYALTGGEVSTTGGPVQKTARVISPDERAVALVESRFVAEKGSFRAKSEGRVKEVDEEATEAFRRAASLEPWQRVYFDGAWGNYVRTHDKTLERIGASPNATKEDWVRTKAEIDDSIEDLSRAVREVKRTSKP